MNIMSSRLLKCLTKVVNTMETGVLNIKTSDSKSRLRGQPHPFCFWSEMVREWCGNGVGILWEWCGNGVGMVLEWCGKGVVMVW